MVGRAPLECGQEALADRTGHIDPFDFRRADWVSTLHRWFDHELQGVRNDVLTEPQADVEYAADEWQTFTRWPIDARQEVSRTRRRHADDGRSPRARAAADAEPASCPPDDHVDTPSLNETNAISNPTTVTANCRVFLSAPLEAPVHISGTPVVRIRASVNATDTNFGGVLVDYGPATQVSRTGDGAFTLATEDRRGETSTSDEACYLQVEKRLTNVTQWRVSKGILDALNRNSYAVAELLTPDQEESSTFRCCLRTTSSGRVTGSGSCLSGATPATAHRPTRTAPRSA